VALHTFSTADLFNRYAVNLLILEILVEFLVNAVKLVVSELNLGLAVTVDTPAHAEVGKLLHLAHFLDLTMTGLTILLANGYVLRVVEIYVVGQIVYTDPFNRLALSGVLLFCRIPTGIGIELLNLRSSIHLGAVFPEQLGPLYILIDTHVAVHTNIH